jgi:RNA polymerase sigma-70 factor (ECF subfamily)
MSAPPPPEPARRGSTRPPVDPIAGSGLHERTALAFDEVYAEHFPFVYRTMRRAGVPLDAVDDAVQEVFVVVHRRLAEFEGRAALTTWLYRIVVRVAQHHRRTARRKGISEPEDPDTLPMRQGEGPHEDALRAEGVRLLQRVLGELDDDKRMVFVLAEYEELSVRAIAEATGENQNTVASRLRAARIEFDQAVKRHQALDQWRMR